MVVEWMHGPCNETGELWSNPGLCVTRVIRQAKPGKDTSALGRFIKVSEECYHVFARLMMQFSLDSSGSLAGYVQVDLFRGASSD
jgi:hypothetical protein